MRLPSALVLKQTVEHLPITVAQVEERFFEVVRYVPSPLQSCL